MGGGSAFGALGLDLETDRLSHSTLFTITFAGEVYTLTVTNDALGEKIRRQAHAAKAHEIKTNHGTTTTHQRNLSQPIRAGTIEVGDVP